MDVILNPSLSFNQSIQNDSTLRLTIFMLLKTINFCQNNNKQSYLQNIDETFDEFNKTPSKFYEIFTSRNNNQRLLQFNINNDMDSNESYQIYVNKLSEIMPELISYLNSQKNRNKNDISLNNENLLKLSINYLNMIFVNGFGIRYSLLHDDDMLGLSLFYNTSFFNHSCSPNAFYHFMNGNKIIIRTLREIKKNEMITISIVDDLECHNKQQRQEMLLNHFGFNCLCDRCLNEEYIEYDQLLTQRMCEKDCILNNKQHINLLNYARSSWVSSPANSWKFYQRLFTNYQYNYHPFDPDILSLLQEISNKAFMMKDYQIGYDSAELGKQFCERLTGCGVVDNCHLAQFRFIFLSFLHYLHLIKQKFPNQQIDAIMKLKGMEGVGMDDIKEIAGHGGGDDEVIMMNDQVLAQMFQNDDDLDVRQMQNTQDFNIDDLEDIEDIKDIENIEVDTAEIDELRYTPPIKEEVDKLQRKSKEKSTKQQQRNSKGNNNKKKSNGQNNKNKNNKHQYKKPSKKSKNKSGNKHKGNNRNNNNHNKKKKNNNNNSQHGGNKKKSRDKNVEVYTFGVGIAGGGGSGMNDDINDIDVNEYDERMFEMKDAEEDSLEYQLNEKIIELYATRSVLFPKFEDFQSWIGKDLLMMDERIENVVTSLKEKFDQTV